MSTQSLVSNMLANAGISIDGSNPWDIQVRDRRFFERVVRDGTLGFADAYMAGWVECQRIDQMAYKCHCTNLADSIDPKQVAIERLKAQFANRGSPRNSFEIGKFHYDTGNKLFRLMLDPYMIYSCAYWLRAQTLEQAQIDKLELICRKLELERGMRVLDIGCGWAGFARYAAAHYGVEVVGITVSNEQLELGRRLCEGMPIELRLQDYRDVDEKFDRILSIGMFEHVGHRYYKEYFASCERNLKPSGLVFLHTVGFVKDDPVNRWFEKYIMRGVAFPTMSKITASSESLLALLDFHNWEGTHYDRTLMAWFDNFEVAWPKLEEKYDQTFYRMWKLYLQGCAGSFRADRMQVWQLVFQKPGKPVTYSFSHHYPLD